MTPLEYGEPPWMRLIMIGLTCVIAPLIAEV
jgi:hypothetical protein